MAISPQRAVRQVILILWETAWLILAVPVLLLVLGPRALWQRREKVPSVVWGPTPVLQRTIVSTAERRAGLKSSHLIYLNNFHRVVADIDLDRWWRRSNRFPLQRAPLAIWAFAWAAWHHRVFMFDFYGTWWSYGEAFVSPWAQPVEFALARVLGKKLVFHGIGCDVRLRSRALTYPTSACLKCENPCSEAKERRIKATVERYSKAADLLLTVGDLIEYIPGGVQEYYLSLDLDVWRYVGAAPHEGPVRIVHAPNFRGIKGTEYILQAVQALQAEGLPIEMVLIEGKSNAEARELYRTADIVVDQLMIGWYGLCAIENMALGKPVVCNFRQDLREGMATPLPNPIVHADPDGIQAVLRDLVTDPARREQLGRQGRAFIEAVYAPDAVVRRLSAHYRRLLGLPAAGDDGPGEPVADASPLALEPGR